MANTPGILDHQGERRTDRLPPQLPHGCGTATYQARGIALAARPALEVNGSARHLLRLGYHATDRETLTASETEDTPRTPRLEPAKSQNVGVHQVADMDIIANASPVRRQVIRPIDCEVLTLPARHLKQGRDKIRLGNMELSKFRLWIGTRYVKIAEHNGFYVIRFSKINNHIVNIALVEPYAFIGVLWSALLQ